MALAQINLTDLVTLSRSTTATRVNSAGLIETVAAGVARIDYDPVTKECLGFLAERASTNLCTQSEFGNGLTDAPASGGLLNPVAFGGLLSNAGIAFGHDGATSSYAYKVVSATSGAITLSVFVRMDDGFPPSFGSATATDMVNDFALVAAGGAVSPLTYVVKDYGGGLYRVSVTSNGSGEAAFFGVVKYNTNSSRTFKVSGYQLESQPYATSYIPTTTSQVTRAADAMGIYGVNFPRFYDSNAGTFVVEYAYAGGGSERNGSDRLPFIVTGKPGNAGYFYNGANRAAYYYQVVSNVNNAAILTANSAARGQMVTVALGLAHNDVALAMDGVLEGTDNSAAMLIGPASLGIGTKLDGHIKRLKYFPTRLSNTKLQELSA